MATQTYQSLISGDYKNTAKLKLTSLPQDFDFSTLLPLAATLTHLDLSNTHLSTLPSTISQFHHLKILFLSSCAFKIFPDLSKCPALEMVAFKSNGMTTIPEHHFPPNLRWLILTDNKIEKIPQSIGGCSRLQKCMLAGNQLRDLPQEMQQCKKLALLRISANQFTVFPLWLLEMPELAHLAFGGNPVVSSVRVEPSQEHIPWNQLETREILGQGASGIIYRGYYRQAGTASNDVAIKLFKGAVTSDGLPHDEMIACVEAGKHSNLINPLAPISGYPERREGLVLELISPNYKNLGGPPNLDTCSRDTYPPDTSLTVPQVKEILAGIASAAEHIHARGISHGDLYAHNILFREDGHALLGDFGAATIYKEVRNEKLEKLEVLAFAHLIEDMLSLMKDESEQAEKFRTTCKDVWVKCSRPVVSERPLFSEILPVLST